MSQLTESVWVDKSGDNWVMYGIYTWRRLECGEMHVDLDAAGDWTILDELVFERMGLEYVCEL